MNRVSLKIFGRTILAPALLAIALSTTAFVHGAAAQKVDDGTESGAENNLFDDDGFRPVWAQKHVAKPAPAKQHPGPGDQNSRVTKTRDLRTGNPDRSPPERTTRLRPALAAPRRPGLAADPTQKNALRR